MPLFRRGSVYYIDYCVNGRRIREAVSESRKLAETVLAKRRLAVAEGKFLDIRKTTKITFDEFGKTYLELHSNVNKRPRVARRDFFLINRLGAHFKGRYLCEISPQSIEQYKSERIKDAAPATVNRELACLKNMFNKAIVWGKAYDNPVCKVKLFKENNQRLRYLEKDEIVKLLDNAPQHLKPILTLAVFTGMRKSEILTLEWKNINFEQGIIYLLQTKNGEHREVIMSNTVKNALLSVRKTGKSPYVFCHKNGEPYLNVRKSFDATLRRCAIICFRFHDLRHTFASQLVMAGVDLKTVQELMGHKTIEMTMRYAHLSPTHKRTAVSILEKCIVPDLPQMPKTEEGNDLDSLPNSLSNN